MLLSKWCHISGLLLVATGISSVAAYADVANPEGSEENSQASQGCDITISTPEGEVGALSCQLGLSTDEQRSGSAAVGNQAGEAVPGTESCWLYYGGCSGADGCSWAEGEGYYAYSCIPYTYAWLIVCDGWFDSWGWDYC